MLPNLLYSTLLYSAVILYHHITGGLISRTDDEYTYLDLDLDMDLVRNCDPKSEAQLLQNCSPVDIWKGDR